MRRNCFCRNRVATKARRLGWVVLALLVVCVWTSGVFAKAEVQPDRRVTFRLNAPAAESVGVKVQFASGVQEMSKSADGVWSVTLGPAEPDIYEYSFVVDGLDIGDPTNPWQKYWGGASKGLVEVTGEKPMFFEEQDVPHGTLHIHRYKSKSLDIVRRLYVFTPPGYDATKSRKYPALYLLHGMGDTETTWTVVGRANLIIDNLLARDKAEPMIIVMPYGHTPEAPPDMRSIGRYDAFEKDLLEDVIPYVQSHYRVSEQQKDRAIAGLSMGGGQALAVGLGNRDVFGWLGAFSSAVPDGGKLDELLAEPNSINEKLQLLWVGCGKQDFLFEANRDFLERLEAEEISHVAHITEGAHEWLLWRRYLNEFAPLLFKKQ